MIIILIIIMMMLMMIIMKHKTFLILMIFEVESSEVFRIFVCSKSSYFKARNWLFIIAEINFGKVVNAQSITECC